jgi:hypothetical protein
LAAEAAGFEVMITVDRSILDQQNFSSRKMSVLILCAPTNRLKDLKRLAPIALGALDSIEPVK